MIKSNLKLFHIDLSETGITADIINHLIKHIKISTSLVGVHLSGNPGMTVEMEESIIK
jgi:hypothetical protein